MAKMLTSILSFLPSKIKQWGVMIFLMLLLLGYIKYQSVSIDKLEKDKIELQESKTSLESELNKKKNDHEFDYIPPKGDIKDNLDKEEKDYLKDNKIKPKDVVNHGKIKYGVDTLIDSKSITKVEKDTIIDSIPLKTYLHKLDFSNEWIINEATFNTLGDSIFNAKSKLIVADTLRYTMYKSKQKIGTRRFLIIFKLPKYQKVTRVKVKNTNPFVKLNDLEVIVTDEK